MEGEKVVVGTVWWLLLYEKEEDNKRRCGYVGSGWRIVIMQIATIRASWFDNSSVHCFVLNEFQLCVHNSGESFR